MRILVVSPFLPHARAAHGGGAYLHAFVAALAARTRVDLLAFATPAELAAGARPAAALGRRLVLARPERGDLRGLAGCGRQLRMLRRFLWDGLPVVVAKFATPTCAALLARLTDAGAAPAYDAVLYEMDLLAQYLPAHRTAGGPLRVLTDHEGGDPVPAGIGPTGVGRRRDRRLWARYVERCYPRADLLQALNEPDAARLEARFGRPVVRRPAVVRCAGVPCTDLRRAGPHALFLGDFRHLPNPRTARHLIDELVPRLRAAGAPTLLRIAGRGSRAALPEVPPGVEVLDFVADLDALLADTRVLVAPAFSGGGTRIKLLTALAHGVPVVTNALGGRGLPAGEAEGVHRTEDADRLAELVVRLSTAPDPALGAAARQACARHHAPEAVADAQLTALEHALAARR